MGVDAVSVVPASEKRTVTLTVESAQPNASGKVYLIACRVGEKPATFKMFAASFEKHSAAISPGQTVEVEIENKGDGGKADWFILWPKNQLNQRGASRGGVAKSDPEKNRVIENANKRNNDTVTEANIRNSRTALMVAILPALGEDAKDLNKVRGYFEDIVAIVEARS